ncbi:hypothetical protein P879_05652 [Paragonimus westermani]|uniref:Autophagy-related protein 9 n=1 Tax=Paragonimus westermani TaxID=34504 RepID=A0A8T0DHQ3_9TREM|nr:hypothetical protein P879_05652 [Paragonimus westermani]
MVGEVPSKGQYQQIPEFENERELQTSVLYPNRYREHMKYSRNPDQFYVDIYKYHQCGGFWAALLAEVFWIVKFVFVIFVGTELTVCTRWDVLANSTVPVQQWSDVFTPPNQCWANLPLLPSLLVAGAIVGLLVQLLQATKRLQRYWETRSFCTYILDLPTSATGLGDMTWSEVQKRLIDSQQHSGLDELAIYHRILRHENYLVAMIDQDVLPVRFNISSSQQPWMFVYLPDSYLFNLRLLLFWTPWSPFCQNWQLQAEYKEITRRHELAAHLTKMSRILGLLNLLFAPVILFAQLLVFICSNAERIRYQPASILGRRWSNYAHLYLRHYNELQHQFTVRLNLAYQPACDYLDCFVSRNLITLAETGAFVLGSASFAFFIMGLVHEQMMHLAGYWAILVCGGLLARACLTYIPDEHVVHSPQALLITILGKIHRVREHWIEQGATSRVRAEFSQLFQYRLSAALEDLVSCIITPFLLMFVVPKSTLEIVDFLRNYTVELKELGDVCSFSQMDVRRHGDPQWKFFVDGPDEPELAGGTGTNRPNASELESQQLVSTWGKTELSLMHFHLNNPNCALPAVSRAYLQGIRKQLLRDMQQPLLQPSPDLTNMRPSLVELNGQPFTTGLLTSLYNPQGVASSGVMCAFGSNTQLKNVSHLPGPGYISGQNMGFVGAMVESLKNSMHRSDPGMVRSTVSDSSVPKPGASMPSNQGEPTPAVDVGGRPISPPLPPTSIPGPVRPTQISYDNRLLAYHQPCNSDPINMSLMAASVLYSTNTSGHPAYKPYVSQMENGSSQNWGLASSGVFGYSASRHGLTDLFTADTSASILYMHELATRRRLQQSTGPFLPQQRQMGRSYAGHLGDPYLSTVSGAASYQLPVSTNVATAGGTSGPSRTSSTNTSGLPSERGHIHRFGYGATSSSEPVGIIRTSLDNRRFQRPLVTDLTEEEDELVGTPRAAAEPGAFRSFLTNHDTLSPATRHLSGQNVPAGIVTVSTSPSLRPRPLIPHAQTGGSVETNTLHPSLNDDTDHVWPDLPPTNC